MLLPSSALKSKPSVEKDYGYRERENRERRLKLFDRNKG
jgi:hypothetical protein